MAANREKSPGVKASLYVVLRIFVYEFRASWNRSLSATLMSESPDKSHPMERRLVLRLLKYWRDIGGDERFPAAADIDTNQIADMWQHCALLEVAGHEHDPVIGYIGTALADGAASSLEGQPLTAASNGTLAAHAMSYYSQVLTKKVPITYGGEFVDKAGNKVLYRSIVLPLADNGSSVDRLLCAANCRVVAPQ